MKRRCINRQPIPVILTLLLAWFSFCSSAEQRGADSVASPDGKLKASLEWNEGRLFYALSLEKRVLVERSEISILDDAAYHVVSTRRASVRRSWKPVWGHFSTIQDNFNELTLELEAGDLELQPLRSA